MVIPPILRKKSNKAISLCFVTTTPNVIRLKIKIRGAQYQYIVKSVKKGSIHFNKDIKRVSVPHRCTLLHSL